MQIGNSGMLTPTPPTIVSVGAQQDEQFGGSETPRFHVGAHESELVGALQTKLQKLQAQTEYDEEKLLRQGRYMCQKSGANEVMKVLLQEGNATPVPDQFLRSITPPAAVPTPMPAPPKPHEVPRPGKALFAAAHAHVISRGSVGHPKTCAAACKHVKRKGGCKLGADCPQCHECFWVKDSAKAVSPAQAAMRPDTTEEEERPEISVSAGSLNHPHGCGQACKYVRRKGGCQDGHSCPNCHFCQWTRQGKKEMPSDQSSFVLNLDELVPESTPMSLAEGIVAAANLLIPKSSPPGLQAPTTTSMPPLSVLGVHGEAPQSQNPKPPLCLSVGSAGHPYTCGAACKYAQKSKGCKDGVNCDRCHLCRWSRYTKTEKTEETMGNGCLFTLGNISKE